MMSHYPISKDNPIVLASISPRRKAILRQIGIPFEAVGQYNITVKTAGYLVQIP
jgi:predicted house-cleaning NTP pyrophosphatase (Maf/HAM1 superfamily)